MAHFVVNSIIVWILIAHIEAAAIENSAMSPWSRFQFFDDLALKPDSVPEPDALADFAEQETVDQQGKCPGFFNY